MTLTDRKSLLQSAFIVSLATELVKATKQYFPELTNHIKRVILMETTRADRLTGSVEPFPKLSLSEVFSAGKGDLVQQSDRLKSFLLCLEIVPVLAERYAGLPAYAEIFSEILESLRKFLLNTSLEGLKIKLDSLESTIEKHRNLRQYLSFFKKKPAPLNLLEPKLDNK